MSEVRDLLISGSEEVIGRYRLPLAGAKSDQEREFYRRRLEQGQRPPDELGRPLSERVRRVNVLRFSSLDRTGGAPDCRVRPAVRRCTVLPVGWKPPCGAREARAARRSTEGKG